MEARLRGKVQEKVQPRRGGEEAWEKAEAALEAGVFWLEGALAGVGGCPFAGDELVGNLPTELLLPHLEARGLPTGVDLNRLPALAGEAARLRALYA